VHQSTPNSFGVDWCTPSPTLIRRTATPAPIRAPRRFDTHNVRIVEDQIEQQRAVRPGQLVVDGSDVAFVDRDAVDMLVSTGLGRVDRGLRIERPSLALQISLELLGHQPAPMERAA